MSVTFRSKQSYFTVPYEELFHVGVVNAPFDGSRFIGSSEEWERLQSLPDPERVNKGYTFMDGVNHNEITLEREDAIEGMRAYITARHDNFIVELDAEGNEPADPVGTPFIAKIAGYVLYPAVYKGCTTAEGKAFRFVMGAERNKYITFDKEEIAILRSYVKNTANCIISDPTYKPPFSEV